jgi:hypothetical protein
MSAFQAAVEKAPQQPPQRKTPIKGERHARPGRRSRRP